MSQVEKLSVSMPTDVMDWIRREASQHGSAVSAVLTRLAQEARQVQVERAARLAAVDSLLDELLDSPLTAEELETAEDQLSALE